MKAVALKHRSTSAWLHVTTSQKILNLNNIHDLSEIRTHDFSVQALKAYASENAATGTGAIWFFAINLTCQYIMLQIYLQM
jgi:hypothetical protein